MKESSTVLSGPKLRIIDAAEKLFAAKGFDAVSVRDITKEAGANVAAVNYHFGSREGLVSIVVSRYMGPVNEERLRLLDELEAKWEGKVLPIEEVAEAYVRPLVSQVRKSDLSEKLFCKLVGRIFGEQFDCMPPEIERQFVTLIGRYGRAAARSLPHLSVEEVIWRLNLASGSMIHMLTYEDALFRLTKGASGSPSIETNISRFVRFAAAGMKDGAPTEQKSDSGTENSFEFE
ncbi:TetR family transcriptional regulator [Luteolibacter pohnpeiensis]|uniref:TetR family transcriptional regulator n=1 Tax=Luteolibacter pohnpeiensis TaxID=454153 RepID=A0A934SEQ3_9BACT|nr:TetR/AcrR family transcriptional regulator [Luteolibacter pohnpeiensis]MBK1883833.1 TetR family transcriptional regulator [Luteolibacter pohnpeiensis]